MGEWILLLFYIPWYLIRSGVMLSMVNSKVSNQKSPFPAKKKLLLSRCSKQNKDLVA